MITAADGLSVAYIKPMGSATLNIYIVVEALTTPKNRRARQAGRTGTCQAAF
jgi:hypothetical protein